MAPVHPTGPSLRRKVFICAGVNVGLLIFVVVLVGLMRGPDSKFFRMGPSEDLVVIGVKINTWARYAFLMAILAIVSCAQVVVEDISGPILAFNIFDPHRLEVTDFTSLELNALSNTMSFISGVRGVFSIQMYIAQIDVALANVIFSDLMSIYTVGVLLSRKTFLFGRNRTPVRESDFIMMEPSQEFSLDDDPDEDTAELHFP